MGCVNGAPKDRPGNADVGGLPISDPLTQVEIQTLGDKCKESADDVRALPKLVHALRTTLVAEGLVKGNC